MPPIPDDPSPASRSPHTSRTASTPYMVPASCRTQFWAGFVAGFMTAVALAAGMLLAKCPPVPAPAGQPACAECPPPVVTPKAATHHTPAAPVKSGKDDVRQDAPTVTTADLERADPGAQDAGKTGKDGAK